MTSYRGVEAVDWFGFSRLWSLPVGYATTTSRIDSLNRTKTLNESLATAGLLFFGKGDDGMSTDILYEAALTWKELMQFNYVFTYGYKKQLHTITCKFHTGSPPL